MLRKSEDKERILKRRCTYIHKGVTKAAVNIVVPKHLVTEIIGKNEKIITSIVNKSGCIIRLDQVIFFAIIGG